MSWKKCNQEAMSWKRIERDRSDGEGQGTVMLQKETLPQHNSLVVGDVGYVNVMRVLRLLIMSHGGIPNTISHWEIPCVGVWRGSMGETPFQAQTELT